MQHDITHPEHDPAPQDEEHGHVDAGAGAGTVPVPGSRRSATAAATEPLAPGTEVEATVVLRRRAPLPDVAEAGEPLSSEELGARYGAAPADVAAVEAAVRAAGAHVVETNTAARTVRVRGRADVLSRLFATPLAAPVDGPAGQTRMRTGPVSVPANLDGIVVAVLGLDDRPTARTRHVVANANALSVSYTPPELATIYGFPAGDGKGQVVAIIELGGGFTESDLTAYFRSVGVAEPKVTAVGVDGAKNAPEGDAGGADGEVLLDIEVAGAAAPGAEQRVYFAPNTDAGFLDAITAATHATPAPCAISISWGQSEDQWTAQARGAMDAAFADAVAMGITVTVAAGDAGSSDGDQTGTGEHCDFPASSPHVLACGGTSLQSAHGTIKETVWHRSNGATGGGVSDVFPLPAWQKTAGVPANPKGTTGRGVPDVAAVADPQTGYQVLVDGQHMVMGGTSAVAPLWAALIARVVAATGKRTGLLQTSLYAGVTPGQPQRGFRDITGGRNGIYAAKRGWDACTGLGVPTKELFDS